MLILSLSLDICLIPVALRHKDIHPGVAEYAVEVVHSVRQRMAAEVYLSFAVSVVLNKVREGHGGRGASTCSVRQCVS